MTDPHSRFDVERIEHPECVCSHVVVGVRRYGEVARKDRPEVDRWAVVSGRSARVARIDGDDQVTGLCQRLDQSRWERHAWMLSLH